MLRANPRYLVKMQSDDGTPVVDLIFDRYRDKPPRANVLEHWEEVGIPLGYTGRMNELVFFGSGRAVLWLRPLSRTIYFWNDPADLNLVHVLDQLANEPELEDFELVRRIDDYDDPRCWTPQGGKELWCGEPLGITLGQFQAALQQVESELPARDRFHDEPQPRLYRYKAYLQPQDIEWYHATLARNVGSILSHGLRPSQTGEGGGWSPHWNMGLQSVVYLTADYDYAASIAETIALRAREDSVVLAVDGRALELERLRIDEDAAIDPDSGSVSFGMVDADWPEWESSWHQYRGQSLGYAGIIHPEHLRVVGQGRYSEETYTDAYDREMVEEEVEWTDLEA